MKGAHYRSTNQQTHSQTKVYSFICCLLRCPFGGGPLRSINFIPAAPALSNKLHLFFTRCLLSSFSWFHSLSFRCFLLFAFVFSLRSIGAACAHNRASNKPSEEKATQRSIQSNKLKINLISFHSSLHSHHSLLNQINETFDLMEEKKEVRLLAPLPAAFKINQFSPFSKKRIELIYWIADGRRCSHCSIHQLFSFDSIDFHQIPSNFKAVDEFPQW